MYLFNSCSKALLEGEMQVNLLWICVILLGVMAVVMGVSSVITWRAQQREMIASRDKRILWLEELLQNARVEIHSRNRANCANTQAVE